MSPLKLKDIARSLLCLRLFMRPKAEAQPDTDAAAPEKIHVLEKSPDAGRVSDPGLIGTLKMEEDLHPDTRHRCSRPGRFA
jgi:hypothetical protein